jgi:hypothetical protein
VLTLVLTALLAWPWNVVLARAESLQMAGQVRIVSHRTQHSPGVQRPARYRVSDQPSCGLAAPDFNRTEPEGDDDGGAVSPDWDVASVVALEWTAFAPCSVSTWRLPAGPGPRIHLCRLRC